jgi:hypothetical protein
LALKELQLIISFVWHSGNIYLLLDIMHLVTNKSLHCQYMLIIRYYAFGYKLISPLPIAESVDPVPSAIDPVPVPSKDSIDLV